jgi:transposase
MIRVREAIGSYLVQLLDDFGQPFVFVDDNAPCHNAITVQKEFAKNGANRIYWPASSPDLNPIENVWGLMKMRLAKLAVKPRNMDELKGKISEIWENLTPDYCKALIYSMPKRCKEVVKAKGWQNRVY